jgi:hypothetical protein
MNRKIQLRGLAFAATVLAVVGLGVSPCAFAQEPQPDPNPVQESPAQDPSQPSDPASPARTQPKPAGRENPIFNEDEANQVQDPNALRPDTNALTGVLVPTVGNPEMRHSYFVPGLQYGNFIRSNAFANPNVTDWNTTSYVAGSLSLLQQWSRAQLAVNYTGGGLFSTDKSQGNATFHQADLVQSFAFRRWNLAIIDQFSYLPQTQFGFATTSVLATPGISGPLGPALPAMQASYQPSQTIFSSLGRRYSNATTAEAAYNLTTRSAITFAASYGLLRFEDPGNFDTNDTIFSAGYDYSLSKIDTIGVLYRYTSYRFLGASESVQDHVTELAYGRKITGRTALQLFVGPEVTSFRLPNGETNQSVSVAGGANLTYTIPRSTLSASYNHGVTGGSGVFTGALTDQIQGTASRNLTRLWAGEITFGYARNAALSSASGVISNSVFDAWYAGGELRRPVGRNANLSVGYTAYIEGSNPALCATGDCTTFVQHQVALSFQWHARPFVLR